MVNKCKICNKDLSIIANSSVISSTFNREICFNCIHEKFKNPVTTDFLLDIPEVTEMEHDVIMNGICKNYFFTDCLNGAVWLNSISETCEETAHDEILDIVFSLLEKGLVRHMGRGKHMTIRLTAEGYFYYLNNR